MGCDIHLWMEIKKKYPNPASKPAWETLGNVFVNPYYRSEFGLPTLSPFDYERNAKFTSQPYSGRNYDLFAILANVRNGVGFAGVDMGDGFNPIDEPRGVPTNASDFYRKKVEDYGSDGHSHSWMTLEDFDEYDWEQTTTHRGMVDMNEYKVFKEKGKPNGYSGGVSGGIVKMISNEKMDELIKEGKTDDEKHHYYTQVEWKETYRESVGEAFFKVIEQMREIKKEPEVLAVRLVYYFDN